MNKKTLSACLIAFILTISAGPAAAQGGCYRHRIAYVKAPMNIRQSQSTGSQVVRIAGAGESFAVSSSAPGETYCWLNIPDGWLAWTRRVSASPPGGTTPPVEQTMQPSDIDNCCFVNRQCATEQQWLDGYWAFQRDECPVSAPRAETSAQPGASTPADADNCCFIGWQCSTDDEWVKGYWARQNNQCGAGPPPSTSVRVGNILIEGSESFQIWVKAGLDLLRQRAPQWYDYVQGATRHLKERPHGTYVVIHLQSGTHETAWDANIVYPSELNIFTIAHEMIHEACHFYQYQRGDSREQLYHEKECVEKEIEAMPLIDPGDRWGRRAHKIWLAANMEHDQSLWWWGEVATCRQNTPFGIGC